MQFNSIYIATNPYSNNKLVPPEERLSQSEFWKSQINAINKASIIHTTPNLDMNNSISSAILDFWQSYYFFPFKTSLRDEKKHGMRLLLCFWAY